MILAVALAGAAGCVAQDDQTASVEQHNGAGFNCQNKHSISGVQCLTSSIVAPITVTVKDVANGNDVDVLDGNKISILDNDLNNLSIGDININVLNDVVDVTKNDFLNKFNITVKDNNVCAAALSLQVCK
ncbi:MAG: hypothetical protein E6J91_45265 [Deltaproteobacteria bacterium]|nr:MAG: hypothetical protein E6J91_45265 [Deltaproteobacteria bacterium]